MSNWPYFSQATEQVIGLSGSTATAVNAPSNIDYGAWVSLGAFSSAVDALYVVISNSNGVTTVGLMFELALDSSGINRIATNISAGRLSSGQPAGVLLPLHVEAGTEIYIRNRASGTSGANNRATIRGLRGGWLNPSGWARAESLAGDVATPNAPGVDCGLTNTWTEITATTTRAYGGLAVACGAAGTTSSRTNQSVVGQVGVGAAASEVVIAGNLVFHSGVAHVGPPGHILVPSPIPEGVRVAVRATAANTSNAFAMDVIGFY